MKGGVGVEFQIKEARERAGYSQKELAQIIGVAQNTFHGYESGKHDPKSDLLIKIANACNVSVDFLLGVEPINTKKSPGAAEAAPEEEVSRIFDKLNDLLVSEGLIEDGEDLTDRQADVILAVCRIINATFHD